MGTVEQIIEVAHRLSIVQVDILLEMALAMTREVDQSVDPDSNIVSAEFAEAFSNRLLIHHATNEEKFKKKSFEYAFCGASRSVGRQATIVVNSCNPGEDVVVDGVSFSLKTEASSGINPRQITISKLMEARWIRECRTGEDFARNVRDRVVHHLQQYERMLMLRAFSCGESGSQCSVRYDLVEIPVSLLLEMGNLASTQFSPRTPNGGSGASVFLNGKRAFSFRLDGSVEKVTVSNLLLDACKLHASWTVPTIGFNSEE